MLVFGQILLGLFLFMVVGFFLYWRFHNTVQGRVAEQREKLLHTEESFAKRQVELNLDLWRTSRRSLMQVASELEEHFPLSYQVNVYNRMVKETKFSEQKIMQLMFEQKRFLIMASVLKHVPMFSKDVDEVWHQMLMFTREYRAFTEGFAGQYIHHAPNVAGVDERDSKFVFDMMYLEFFSPMPFSEEAWGSKFFAQKPSSELLRDVETLPFNVLEARYFFDTSHARKVSSVITANIQSAFSQTQDREKRERYQRARKQTMAEARKRGKKSASFDSPFSLPYVFWASGDDSVPYSDSLGHTSSTSSTDSGSTGSGGGGGGSSNHCSSGSGSSCGSSCGGGGCGSS